MEGFSAQKDHVDTLDPSVTFVTEDFFISTSQAIILSLQIEGKAVKVGCITFVFHRFIATLFDFFILKPVSFLKGTSVPQSIVLPLIHSGNPHARWAIC